MDNKNSSSDDRSAVKVFTPGQERFGRRIIKVIARLQVLVYLLTGGRVWNRFNGGPVALLKYTGRRSGKYRTLPLVYAEDGENVIFAASQGGMSKHPIWYHNLVANPFVKVQIGSKARKMKMREPEGDERDRLWSRLDAVYPDFAEYRERAKLNNRVIPLLLMEPL